MQQFTHSICCKLRLITVIIFVSNDVFLSFPKKVPSFLPHTCIILDKSIVMPTVILSHNNPCFRCNIAITNFVSHTCEIRFNDVIGQSTIPMYSYAKIQKHGWPTWPDEYVLELFFLLFHSLYSVM